MALTVEYWCFWGRGSVSGFRTRVSGQNENKDENEGYPLGLTGI